MCIAITFTSGEVNVWWTCVMMHVCTGELGFGYSETIDRTVAITTGVSFGRMTAN